MSIRKRTSKKHQMVIHTRFISVIMTGIQMKRRCLPKADSILMKMRCTMKRR